MKKRLTRLFDYQKFARNPKLQDVIDSVHKQSRELIPDDAALVSAAGAPYYKPTNENAEESHL